MSDKGKAKKGKKDEKKNEEPKEKRRYTVHTLDRTKLRRGKNMKLNFIIGRPGSGKSKYIYDKIIDGHCPDAHHAGHAGPTDRHTHRAHQGDAVR